MAYTIWLRFDVNSWWEKVDATYIGIFLKSLVVSLSHFRLENLFVCFYSGYSVSLTHT